MTGVARRLFHFEFADNERGAFRPTGQFSATCGVWQIEDWQEAPAARVRDRIERQRAVRGKIERPCRPAQQRQDLFTTTRAGKQQHVAPVYGYTCDGLGATKQAEY